MSEFIALTDTEHDVTVRVRKSSITVVADKYDAPEEGAVVFIGSDQEGTRTRETLDWIMEQIDSTPLPSYDSLLQQLDTLTALCQDSLCSPEWKEGYRECLKDMREYLPTEYAQAVSSREAFSIQANGLPCSTNPMPSCWRQDRL